MISPEIAAQLTKTRVETPWNVVDSKMCKMHSLTYLTLSYEYIHHASCTACSHGQSHSNIIQVIMAGQEEGGVSLTVRSLVEEEGRLADKNYS